ncbi:MAG: glycosyltransferase family 4 protein [Acidobacteria bacterium]|nr:glycosyltransferase family 4 protein [Acidobacteriota bacterium]
MQRNASQNRGTARFLNLGRFSPQDKAQHLLLEALAGREWEKRDWRMTFVGVSDFGKFYLERLIAYYQISPNRISIRPHTSDVFREIAESDVLLMPSRSEGMPFAMLEAVACGRPLRRATIGRWYSRVSH